MLFFLTAPGIAVVLLWRSIRGAIREPQSRWHILGDGAIVFSVWVLVSEAMLDATFDMASASRTCGRCRTHSFLRVGRFTVGSQHTLRWDGRSSALSVDCRAARPAIVRGSPISNHRVRTNSYGRGFGPTAFGPLQTIMPVADQRSPTTAPDSLNGHSELSM